MAVASLNVFKTCVLVAIGTTYSNKIKLAERRNVPANAPITAGEILKIVHFGNINI